ncbi:HNH endonuclease signature motif containing protein [Alteriqipengyuania sp.]|uniref:HNH endonuclease signature motif containing protein n=1 Tax=Alteriqipengyuania sp. TaxID=2800692 RepID=UPI0035126557
MTRLKMLMPRLSPIKPKLKALPKRAERFYQSPEWRGLVKQLKAERGAFCERCGAGGRIIGDHIVERKDGGAELDPSNIRLMCWPCHNAKTARERARRAVSKP